MIYTVTFNPSLDYIVATDSLILGKVNRTVSELILSGGKGVNVSIVLNNLNVKNTALGFIAGFTGKEIENGLKKLGCCCDFITIEKGFSRINIKIKAKEETELNGMGPEISQKELNQLFEKLDCLQSQDILILAGSVPNSLPQNIYEKIMERLQNKNIKIIVDATKDLLINVMKYQPFLVKPNTHELGELFHTTLNTE